MHKLKLILLTLVTTLSLDAHSYAGKCIDLFNAKPTETKVQTKKETPKKVVTPEVTAKDILKDVTVEQLATEMHNQVVNEGFSHATANDILALFKNFSNTPVISGELGITFSNGKLHFNPTSNLVGSFLKYSEKLKPGKLSVDDLIDMKYDNQQFIVTNGKELNQQKGQTSKFKWKSESNNNVSKVPNEVSVTVKARLQEYGIRYEEVKNSQGKIVETKIFYEKDAFNALEKYVKKINDMVESGIYKPIEITAVAVQDFLIIHPFDGGNGRLARLYGQILYKSLKGNAVLFPKEFYEEMNHDVADLIKPFYVDGNYRNSAIDIKIETATLDNQRVLPKKYIKYETIHVPLDPRGYSRVNNYQNLELLRPLRLEPQHYSKAETVYWGGPKATYQDAVRAATDWMTFGRQSRNKSADAVLDIQGYINNNHVGGNSGLFSTSYDANISILFAQRTTKGEKFGIHVVIDARELSGISVDALAKEELINTRFSEKEVIFGNINPQSVKAVYVLEAQENGSFKPILRIENPNYSVDNR